MKAHTGLYLSTQTKTFTYTYTGSSLKVNCPPVLIHLRATIYTYTDTSTN